MICTSKTLSAISFIALLLISNPCSFSQHSYSDSSRLKDPSYVKQRIHEISDPDLWISLDLAHPGLEKVNGFVRSGNYQNAAEVWAGYWKTKKQPRYVSQTDHLLIDTEMLTDVPAFRKAMHDSFEERDSILARAGMMMNNIIRTWGDYVIAFGDKVDFNREVGQSGKYGFHYWIWSRPLIMAAELTGDQKYTAKFDELFNTWYEQRNSIVSTIPDLDVVYYELGPGVRNRMFIENYLLSNNTRTAETHERMLKTVLAAGRWLYELQRWEGYRPGNWQIHGSYMLVQLALVFPEFRESSEWLRIGLQRMTEHLEKDFFSDGGHSERCPRNYTQATYLSFRNLHYLLGTYKVRKDIKAKIRASIGRTIDWWITMLAPTGEIPAINDSHRGLFPLKILRDGAESFGKPVVYSVLRNLFAEKRKRKEALPVYTSRHMPESGFSVMRTDWTPDALYMTVNYGPEAGFHSHFDLLDFELYAYGKPLAIDAGIGLTYDDPLYNPWYRSTKAHNMVAVNDSNIERVGVKGENIKWGSTRSLDYFSGEHRGYRRFGIMNRREIAFVKPSYWFILDELFCERGGDTLSWYFHSPETLVPSGSGFVSASSPGLRIMPVGQDFRTRTGRGMAASTKERIPGKVEEIGWIRFDQTSVEGSAPQFPILLAPFLNPSENIFAEKISPRHFVVKSSASADHLYFTNGKYSDGTMETDGMFVLVKLQGDGTGIFSVVDATYLNYKGKPLWKSATAMSADGKISF